MPVFKIHHVTRYEYNNPINESVNEIRIMPYQCPEQEVLQQNLNITGLPQVYLFNDYWENNTGTFNLLTPHQELVIDNKLIVRTTSPSEVTVNYNSGFDELGGETKGRLRMLELTKPDQIELNKKIKEIIQQIRRPSMGIAHIVEASSSYVFTNFQ